MYEVVEKRVDKQNRLLLPAGWVKQMFKKTREALVIRYKDSVKVIPKSQHKLSDFFDMAKPNDEINPFSDYRGALAKASLRVK